MFDHVEPGYDGAQICRRGHLISPSTQENPELMKKFCPKCGAATLTNCEHCRTPIDGQYRNPDVGFRAMDDDDIASYCHGCGKPYPWQQEQVVAANAYADEVEGLTDAEKIDLKAAIENLLVDTPMTKLSAERFKRLMARARGPVARGLVDLISKIAVESAKTVIMG